MSSPKDTYTKDPQQTARAERDARQNRNAMYVLASLLVVGIASAIIVGFLFSDDGTQTALPTASATPDILADLTPEAMATTDTSATTKPRLKNCANPAAKIIEPTNGREIDGDVPMNLRFILNCLPRGHQARLIDKPVNSDRLFATGRTNPLFDDGTETDGTTKFKNNDLHFQDSAIGGEGTPSNPTTTMVQLRIYAGPPNCIKQLDSQAARDGLPISELHHSCKKIASMTFTSTRDGGQD